MVGIEYGRRSGSYSTQVIGTYELISQNIENNYSTVRSHLYFYYGGGTSVGSDYSSFGTMGVTVKEGAYRYYPGETYLGYADITVYHNQDGTSPEFSLGFWANSYHFSSGETWGTIGAGSLTRIPRQANISTAPDFNDEQNPTITYSNPAGNSVTSLQACISLTNSTDDIAYRDISKTGTSYTFNLTTAERNTLINATTTSNSRTIYFTIKTVIGGSTYYSNVQKTFSIINANPTFSNFTFADTNSTTTTLTGNNQNIIKNYSNVQVTISTANKATANKSATMSRYRFTCGDKNAPEPMNYSSDSNVTGTINGVPNGTFNVYATDSRNNSTQVTKLANQVIDYSPLTKGNISVTRSNGVSEQTTLQFNGTINTVNFGSVTNSIKQCKYRYKTGSGNWSTYTNITPTVSSGQFSFNALIQGDTNNGFNIENTYNIEVYVKDELSEVTFTATLNSGIPNLALHKDGVGIMGKYDTSEGGLLQIGGRNIFKYSTSELDTEYYWIDGKKIYTRTFTFTTSSGTNIFTIDINPSTISEIWLAEPSFCVENGNYVYPLLGGTYNTTGDWIFIRLVKRTSNYGLELNADSAHRIGEITVTVEYTKSS